MTTWIIISLLAVLVGAVCWLAVETRRVHLALHLYAAAVKSWQDLLVNVETRHGPRP